MDNIQTFKAGDKVRWIANPRLLIKEGCANTVERVKTIYEEHEPCLKLLGHSGYYYAKYFELVEEENNCGFAKDE